MSRCNKKGLPNDMPINKVKEILNCLFIIGHRPVQRKAEECDREDITYNTTLDKEDVGYITGKINGKKAVGIDGIPGEIVKLLVNNRRKLFTKVINNITDSGRIPRCWKTARVILLRKPGKDPKLPNANRPISIFPALSELWEQCLKEIVERRMGAEPFHRRQYGFRKRRSTVDAITRMIKFADTCKKKRVICLMITMDIKNAFNTLSWDSIIGELTRRKLPSVWYGGVRDDLAITCAAKKNEGVSGKVGEIMKTVCDWCASVGLTLAKDKTEVILIIGMRVIGLNVGGLPTNTVEAVKYLGVTIDSHRKFDKHIVTVYNKADIRIGALRGILPNINGPPGLARRLYYNVWESIVT
ncbi:uncharacterized protein LOC117239029 [Bombus vosnesenskii]|uniref:Uncharacterized protein LOC117239029 n=1 Tax=Bombus vosnesenskii TaxID=207650 RepID=A0A6J3L4J0_9HYME|nr:uncharacterized protein LOC117239029 [Bombus vosnesenskii]